MGLWDSRLPAVKFGGGDVVVLTKVEAKMEDGSLFPHTLEALHGLADDLKCSKCLQLIENLFSMGVCEHMLCNECVEGYLGNDCPLCGLPTHVKDAQVNRQLCNVVKLCRELKGLLTGGTNFDDTGTEDEEEENVDQGDLGNSEPMATTNGCSVFEFKGTPRPDVRQGQRNKRTINYREMESSDISEGDLDMELKRTPAEDSVKSGKRVREKRVRRSPGLAWSRKRTTANGLRQATLTQLFDDDTPMSNTKSPVTPKVRRPVSRKINSTPGKVKSQSLNGVKGNNSCAQGRQLCASPLSTSSCLQSPRMPSSCKRRPIDLNAKKNSKGETPLHIAVIKGDSERVRSLLEDGANPNTKDHAGWTPLHEACNHGYTEIAELLLNNGALINTPGMENDSPLHDAVSNNRVDCVRLLVSRGASQTSRNIYGQTVRDIAVTEDMKAALDTDISESEQTPNTVLTEWRSEGPVVLLGTALTRDQKMVLQKSAGVLSARVVEDFTPEVTHVITSSNKDAQCPRTLKYLRAILTGKWVLNMEWVKMCIEYGSRVSEEAFEVSGSTPNPDTMASSRGRCNEEQQLPRLFDGCKFYFCGTFEHPTPDVMELIQLVRCGGGTILSREPKLQTLDESSLTVPYHASPESAIANCGIFVVYDNNADFQPIRSSHLCTVTVSWLMDSIASFKLLDLPQIQS